VSTACVNAIAIYEQLRAAVLEAGSGAGPNLGVLRREGLPAWLRSLSTAHNVDAPLPDPSRQLAACSVMTPAPSELTRLIASIVLAITAEPAHV
jgi:hypothetical protein